MEFNGRSVDPAGHPAGRTDFFGIVTAELEDSLLYCEERMIAYTDRLVPLAKLGALSKSESCWHPVRLAHSLAMVKKMPMISPSLP